MRNENPVALLMMDLDHFKRFNDTFGHQAGDKLLRALGDFITERTRGQDVACRYGGEEFAVILSGASLEAAVKRAELLRQELKCLSVDTAPGSRSKGSLSPSAWRRIRGTERLLRVWCAQRTRGCTAPRQEAEIEP